MTTITQLLKSRTVWFAGLTVRQIYHRIGLALLAFWSGVATLIWSLV